MSSDKKKEKKLDSKKILLVKDILSTIDGIEEETPSKDIRDFLNKFKLENLEKER